MIPTPARCLAMAVSAIALAVALLMAGVPGAVLLGLTPGIVCLAMYFAMGHGDPDGEQLLRTARMATGRQSRATVDGASRAPDEDPRSMRTVDDHR